MTKTKTSDSFIKTNEEYVKARTTEHEAGAPYREDPQQQAPGRAGYDKPDFTRWTDEELVEHARGLGLLPAEGEAPDRADVLARLDEAYRPRR